MPNALIGFFYLHMTEQCKRDELKKELLPFEEFINTTVALGQYLQSVKDSQSKICPQEKSGAISKT